MSRLAPILRPLILLTVLLALPAAAEEVDIENAPTPTNLLALLPEGGIEAVQLDAWAVTEASGPNGRTFTLDYYTHWSIKTVDGKLVLEVRQRRPMQRQSLTLQRFTYTAAGDLETYREIRESLGKLTVDMIGRVEGDELVIKPNPKAGIMNPNLARERSVPMETFETHVPIALMPLVRAYHIRQGHFGYHYATIDLTLSGKKVSCVAEDLGSEKLEIQGKGAVGHLLLEKKSHDQRGKQISTQSQTMALQDGSIVSSQSKNGQYTFVTRHVALEDIRERFGIEEGKYDSEDRQ